MAGVLVVEAGAGEDVAWIGTRSRDFLVRPEGEEEEEKGMEGEKREERDAPLHLEDECVGNA